MLAKDQSERPSDADEVLVALEAVDLTAKEERKEGAGSLDSMAGGVFVGRHREMDQLKATFEDVLTGKGRMVTLVGEPGIGKTRTAQELATYAGMRGANVLWGRSYESGGAPPYWPWVQAIRSHVAATDETALRAQMGSTASVIAEVVSDVKTKLPDLPAPTPIEDPESARFRLFDSIATFLKNASQNAPLVLMLEDLHWSDKPSLMLLEFVARELANSRLMIVGNYRDMELNRRHPLSVTLGDLTRDRLFERVVLRGLQHHDVERFIEIAAGISAPAALVDTVHSQTEGNPLFVTETVRLLIQEGDISAGDATKGGTTSWEIRIPEGVREVIGRRLDRLSERCNEVLTTAAVIGRQFRFPVLLKLSDEVSENMLLDVMDEALNARIIEELPEEVGLYQFTHATMQETLTSELSANRTVRMHARIAEALEEHYGERAEEHAAELAEHFGEAEVLLGSEKLVKYSLAAGETALRQYAFDDSLKHFQQGLSAVGEGPMDHVRASLHSGLGRGRLAIYPRSKRLAAIDTLMPAVSFFTDTGEIEQLRPIIRTAGVPISGGRHHGGTDFATMLEIALELFPRADHDRVRGLVDLGHDRLIERGDVNDSAAAIDEADELAKELGDKRLMTAVKYGRLVSAMMSFRDRGKLVERAQELIADAQSIGDGEIELRGRFHLVAGAGELMPVAAVQQEAAAYLSLAREHRNMSNIEQALQASASKSIAGGDFNKALEFLDELDALKAESSLHREWIYALTGDWKEAQEGLDRFLAVFKDSPLGPNDVIRAAATALPHIGNILGRPEVFDVAKTAARALIDSPNSAPIWPQLGETALAWICLLERDEETARSLLPGVADRTWFGHSGPGIGMSGLRLLGEIQCLTGDIGAGIETCEQALSDLRDRGFRLELAMMCGDYPDVLLDRNAPGDRDKAIELQDEAISIATELGMKPLLERVLAKREILKA